MFVMLFVLLLVDTAAVVILLSVETVPCWVVFVVVLVGEVEGKTVPCGSILVVVLVGVVNVETVPCRLLLVVVPVGVVEAVSGP